MCFRLSVDIMLGLGRWARLGWAGPSLRGRGGGDEVESGQVGMTWLTGWGLEDGVQGPVTGMGTPWGKTGLR